MPPVAYGLPIDTSEWPPLLARVPARPVGSVCVRWILLIRPGLVQGLPRHHPFGVEGHFIGVELVEALDVDVVEEDVVPAAVHEEAAFAGEAGAGHAVIVAVVIVAVLRGAERLGVESGIGHVAADDEAAAELHVTEPG